MSWIPILCYHRVCPKNEIGTDSRSLCVTPPQFARQHSTSIANAPLSLFFKARDTPASLFPSPE